MKLQNHDGTVDACSPLTMRAPVAFSLAGAAIMQIKADIHMTSKKAIWLCFMEDEQYFFPFASLERAWPSASFTMCVP